MGKTIDQKGQYLYLSTDGIVLNKLLRLLSKAVNRWFLNV